ncbi:MAG: DUF3667 domain-containing protein [Pirellulaceae bacterium]
MDSKSDQHNIQKRPVDEPRVCRNCGQDVPKLYCSWCGQSVKEIRVSFKTLFFDFLGDYFTVDSKLFRSVIPLFFMPGFLTCAFIQGRRVRYIPPLRLYLFSSVLFFLTLAMVSGGNTDIEPEEKRDIPKVALSGDEDAFDQATKKDNSASATPQPNRREASFTDFRFANANWLGRYFNECLDAQDRKIRVMGYEAFMRALVKEFLSSLPKALFLLMPFFALLLKLCYSRLDPLFIDHLIFSFHYHAFVYVLSSLLLIIGSQTEGLLAFSIMLGFFAYPIYLLVAIKRVYTQSWLWTVCKTSFISTIYFTGLALFMLLFFIFTALFIV